ncbi:hypothetical protein [Peptoniphilus grossensis]|uniref:hypothetical protein n=1 Tax=Peptoniphilus grossensis TaxID=1465756 RepID=UPI0003009A4D|nr:hypothetical protein [Peptoniphilus grossensis]
MLKKLCKCGKAIPITDKMCKDCMSKYHKSYDKYSRDNHSVYTDKRWSVVKDVCKSKANGIDLWIYYKTGKIVEGRLAHHIIEVADDLSRAYDVGNLFWLTDRSHQEIHALYNRDEDTKKKTQQLLFEINKNGTGVGQKVLGEVSKTSARFFSRENARN